MQSLDDSVIINQKMHLNPDGIKPLPDPMFTYHQWDHKSELILGLRPANERRRYKVTPSHWLGANLESAL